MPVFDKVKKGVHSIREKTKGHHKWKMFIYAGIILFLAGYVWLFYTNTGWLARTSFEKTFKQDPNRIVRVYAGNELIDTYVGHYAVEQYQGYLVVIDFDNHERINIYGEVTAIVDSPREQQDGNQQ